MGKMTDQAKENMIMGQKAMRAVDAYLAFIDQHKPRGRKIDQDQLEKKIANEKRLGHKVITHRPDARGHPKREEWLAEEHHWRKRSSSTHPGSRSSTASPTPCGVRWVLGAKVLSKAGITR